jgi:hypothetical protein
MSKELRQKIVLTSAGTAILTLLFILFAGIKNSLPDMLIAVPYFLVLYFLFFSIGSQPASDRIATWIGSDVRKAVVFPAALIVLYYSYVLINGENPFNGTLAIFPFLIFFPVLAFAARSRSVSKFDWYDFTVFVLFLLPTTLISVKPTGELPFHGDGFDSIYRIVIILTAVYAFSIIRNLADVGFYPEINPRKIWIAVWVWLAFYLTVFSIGYSVNFFRIVGHDEVSVDLMQKIFFTILTTFLHTAIFEELFFRGILQNMLAKRIHQAKTWLIFWKWGFAILLPLALLAGYTLKGGMQWFPALMTILIFSGAFAIEKSGKNYMGVYTSLAITSVLFGLVHYHSGAIVYIGFACLAGWAYGYTYIKTKNVFYSALVHALVNSSVLIFGLEMIR